MTACGTALVAAPAVTAKIKNHIMLKQRFIRYLCLSTELGSRPLEKARELWHGKLPVNAVSDRYAITDKYFALDLLGSIYENSGKYDAAVEIYNELYKFQPNEALGEKIKRFKVEHDITAAGAGKPEDKR